MLLKSFGCSFIYGTDLADATDTQYSRMTWPGLLAQDLSYDYVSYAKPGCGNLQITEQILNNLSNDLFVIGWTWIDRFDYTSQATDSWQTIRPTHTDNLAETYYKQLHSQYRDKLTTLLNIKLVIDTLNQRNIPFIMTHIDDLIFETQWHATPAIIELQNYIRPYISTFDRQTFLEFSQAKGFPISSTLHPLEQAHQAAVEYIKQEFKARS